tara:strand:+ start:285 stop:497 length:213 start_codon:yes stop_codon:yes gene_type:complete
LIKIEEQRKRSIVKAISWRLTATAATMSIVYMFTGELALIVGVGAIGISSKMALYYGHERLWSQMSWGRG